jgi:hypothetical protein
VPPAAAGLLAGILLSRAEK